MNYKNFHEAAFRYTIYAMHNSVIIVPINFKRLKMTEKMRKRAIENDRKKMSKGVDRITQLASSRNDEIHLYH